MTNEPTETQIAICVRYAPVFQQFYARCIKNGIKHPDMTTFYCCIEELVNIMRTNSDIKYRLMASKSNPLTEKERQLWKIAFEWMNKILKDEKLAKSMTPVFVKFVDLAYPLGKTLNIDEIDSKT